MELFHGGRQDFMMCGHDGHEQRYAYFAALQASAHEAVYAVGFIALMLGDQAIHDEIQALLQQLSQINSPGEAAGPQGP